MNGLTSRQLHLLSYVASYVDLHGRPPTLREIAEVHGINSVNGVNDHLKALMRKGMLERVAGLARGLVVTPAGHQALGRVGPVEQSVERYIRHAVEKARAQLRVA